MKKGTSILLAALVMAACSSTSAPDTQIPLSPVSLRLVSGDSQAAPVGTELPDPLTVRAEDSTGRGISGRLVNFVVVSGEGSVFAGTAMTDDSGYAKEYWTIGTNTTLDQEVDVRSVDPTTGEKVFYGSFHAIALASDAVSMEFTDYPQGQLAVNVLFTTMRIAFKDQYGNIASGDDSTQVTLTLTNSVGAVVAPLNGTPTKTAVRGVVTFDDISSPVSGSGLSLTASAPGFNSLVLRIFPIH